ncbi:thioredoxin [Roseiarcus fermentans]|uniref:Thioredoxin n=1 Tax=Roseiarcus fermentans TaxID=1473586 RepID=A0A366F7D2_9HYPH|nr:thioredoxin [Roseiarcus fermentans]
MAPIFERAARDLEPRARFATVDVDEEPSIVGRYGVRGILTPIVFDHGEVVRRRAGLVDMAFLRGMVGKPDDVRADPRDGVRAKRRAAARRSGPRRANRSSNLIITKRISCWTDR